MPCTKCRHRDTCEVACDKLETTLASSVDQSEEAYITYVAEPRESIQEEGESFYISRLLDSDARLLSLKDALRPLHDMNDPQAAAVFIMRNYFGVSLDELCRIFKLSKRRIYEIIQHAKRALGRVQEGQDVQEPGGDS